MSEVRASGAPQWYAVYTKPKEENRAEVNLKASGISTFMPRLRERRYHSLTTKLSEFHKPLFPRYLFARFNASEQLHQMTFTRGVCCVVSFGKAPTPVDEIVIETIRSQSDRDGFVNLDEDIINCGDKVLIKAGAFENLRGTVQREVRESKQLLILLSCVSYEGRLLIDRALVKKGV